VLTLARRKGIVARFSMWMQKGRPKSALPRSERSIIAAAAQGHDCRSDSPNVVHAIDDRRRRAPVRDLILRFACLWCARIALTFGRVDTAKRYLERSEAIRIRQQWRNRPP
jgi:hypothetical protein